MHQSSRTKKRKTGKKRFPSVVMLERSFSLSLSLPGWSRINSFIFISIQSILGEIFFDLILHFHRSLVSTNQFSSSINVIRKARHFRSEDFDHACQLLRMYSTSSSMPSTLGFVYESDRWWLSSFVPHLIPSSLMSIYLLFIEEEKCVGNKREVLVRLLTSRM